MCIRDRIQKVEVPITEDETGESLHDKLAEAGAKLCVETLKCLEDKTATWEPQGESTTASVSYTHLIENEINKVIGASGLQGGRRQ